MCRSPAKSLCRNKQARSCLDIHRSLLWCFVLYWNTSTHTDALQILHRTRDCV